MTLKVNADNYQLHSTFELKIPGKDEMFKVCFYKLNTNTENPQTNASWQFRYINGAMDKRLRVQWDDQVLMYDMDGLNINEGVREHWCFEEQFSPEHIATLDTYTTSFGPGGRR